MRHLDVAIYTVEFKSVRRHGREGNGRGGRNPRRTAEQSSADSSSDRVARRRSRAFIQMPKSDQPVRVAREPAMLDVIHRAGVERLVPYGHFVDVAIKALRVVVISTDLQRHRGGRSTRNARPRAGGDLDAIQKKPPARRIHCERHMVPFAVRDAARRRGIDRVIAESAAIKEAAQAPALDDQGPAVANAVHDFAGDASN